MKQINITRDNSGKVTFEPVSIDATDNVFFTNLDPQEAHWPYLNPQATSPDFCANQIGPAPSPNSSQCTVPSGTPPYTVIYKCKLHDNEQGTIEVFAQLAAGTTTLPQVSVNTPFAAPVQVVVGGKSPYIVTGQQFQVTDNSGNVTTGQGSIGPGLILNASTDNQGISVAGIPTLVGT